MHTRYEGGGANMMDYHLHSSVSFDGEGSILDYAEAAAKRGVREFCMTEHYEDYVFDGDKSGLPDMTKYERDLLDARGAYPGISIKKGIEMGLVPDKLERMQNEIEKMELDFVIASQHFVDGVDPYDGHYFDGITIKQGQEKYLLALLYNIKRFSHYNVVGHIGYADKYIFTKDGPENGARPLEFQDFPEILDEILETAIGAGKGIEINTSTLPAYGHPLPHPTIVRRFIELGGEIITIGSDAHSAAGFLKGVPEAAEMLQACGANYICGFNRMQPVFIKL